MRESLVGTMQLNLCFWPRAALTLVGLSLAGAHLLAAATLDAKAPAWLPRQVRDFHDQLERTPANHRDLWYLAVDRLLAESAEIPR